MGGDATVARSNLIIEWLRATARHFPQALAGLGALPMHLRVDVGGIRVAVVHGDADSLAGWHFSQETLATPEGVRGAQARFAEAQVDIFASSHTCLPVLQRFDTRRVVVNNGSAGMPNFSGDLDGLVTRIALAPSQDALYGCRLGEVCVEALALRYDVQGWQRRFLQQWPAGTEAHASYYARISNGPSYTRAQALRVS